MEGLRGFIHNLGRKRIDVFPSRTPFRAIHLRYFSLNLSFSFPVGYSTCHWCHVMERESFESEEIAQILNDKFVSVKVDREERPDVDKVYMTYIQV